MSTTKPEILRPGEQSADGLRLRMGGAGGMFSDANLDLLSRVLDTWFRVPGTNIRFGLDGIIGFIPGLGDIAGGVASCILILAAYFRGVPLVTIARMVANVGVEVVVGAVPVLGNFFDIGWRANRRNYHLLERSLMTGKRDKWKDWLFMAALGLGLMAFAMLPVFLLVYGGGALLRAFGFNVHPRWW